MPPDTPITDLAPQVLRVQLTTIGQLGPVVIGAASALILSVALCIWKLWRAEHGARKTR